MAMKIIKKITPPTTAPLIPPTSNDEDVVDVEES